MTKPFLLIRCYSRKLTMDNHAQISKDFSVLIVKYYSTKP